MDWAEDDNMKNMQYSMDDHFRSSLPHFRWIEKTFPTNTGDNERLGESKRAAIALLLIQEQF
jgi:hypothetical protein